MDKKFYSNEELFFPLYKELARRLELGYFVHTEKGKTVEVLGAVVRGLDPRVPLLNFGTRWTSADYVKHEIAWYDSQSLKVDAIAERAPHWRNVANKYGEVNSNYGWCIYSALNGRQYEHTIDTLKHCQDSRQAIMIYQRPLMHIESRLNGMKDFLCTNNHQFFIRNGELISISHMRSNDAWWGTFNDFPWFATVHMRVYEDLRIFYEWLNPGHMIYEANSFHIYEQHFEKLLEMVKHYENKKI